MSKRVEQRQKILSKCWIYIEYEAPSKSGFYDTLIKNPNNQELSVLRAWYSEADKKFKDKADFIAWMPGPPAYVS